MNYDKIPENLKTRTQWIVWKLEKTIDGKTTKIPYIPKGGYLKKASTTNPLHWNTFEMAVKYCENRKMSGIGFVFTQSDLYCGIDLDNCVDENGEIAVWAKDILNQFSGCYAEKSQSGRGIHIICIAKLPGSGTKKTLPGYPGVHVEIYDQGRFFCMTGNVLDGHSKVIDCQKQVTSLYHTINPKPEPTKPVTTLPVAVAHTNDEIIKKIQHSKQADKFNKLMDGDIAGYPSESEADLALCNIVGFYTQETDQIFSIIQTSKLFDDKWEREDYQTRTIGKALEGITEFYKWKPEQTKNPEPKPKKAARDLEAEKGIIGSILKDNKKIKTVYGVELSTDNFFFEKNQNILGAMYELNEDNETITIESVISRLEPDSKFDAGKYLNECLNYASDDINSLVNAVKSKAQDRQKARNEKQYEGYKSGDDLEAKEFLPIKWIIDGYIPEGLTILAGKPKLGKSWLALNMALFIADGGKCFDVDIQKGAALYLDLDGNERRLKSRAKKIMSGVPIPSNFHYCHRHERGTKGIQRIDQWLNNHIDARLVIIDTFVKFRELSKDTQNMYEKDTTELDMLQKLAEKYHIGIICVHHQRKMGSDDLFDTVLGSIGMTGGVDTVAIMKKDGRTRSDATLTIDGKDMENQVEISIDFDRNTGMWKLLGPAEAYKQSKERQEILDILAKSKEPMTPKELSGVLGKPYNNINKLVFSMVSEGIIQKHSYGKYTIGNSGNSGNSNNSDNSGNSTQELPIKYGR